MPHPGYQFNSSTSQGLHLDPNEFRVAIKRRLGLDTSQGSQCACCPAHSLDPLGHHALTCKCGGDVILRHNALRDTLVHFHLITVRMLLSKLKPVLGSFPTIRSHNLPIFCCRIGTLGGPLPWTSPLSHH